MKNYIQKGNTLTAVLATAVASGQLVLLGNSKTPAVSTGTFAANTPGEYALEGVFEFPADTAAVAAVGDLAYFDDAAGVVTATAGDHAVAGIFADMKAANAGSARVRLLRTS